jgi:hypothetical protein
MKIKGLKSKVEQVTFEGDKHPNYGSVITLNWNDLKAMAEARFPELDDRVISIKVTERGLDFYHSNIFTVGEGMKFLKKVRGGK